MNKFKQKLRLLIIKMKNNFRKAKSLLGATQEFGDMCYPAAMSASNQYMRLQSTFHDHAIGSLCGEKQQLLVDMLPNITKVWPDLHACVKTFSNEIHQQYLDVKKTNAEKNYEQLIW